ncbi:MULTISPECIES: dihydroorotase [unclassified Pseudovibrio]|uniref:dihydroorotase n=1 Tax=unclassified Pseudovibrio TaxID=2627060 RepID=UPI0007AEB100|nr:MULTISPECIES: dihydroorotase [unclassified Pseudovibrio]KZL00604.1 Dihydroorotase [Pseudovibrio sp. W74]KZL06794.1 Dihydroorotase [Pseudovibrio sp. Ad14]
MYKNVNPLVLTNARIIDPANNVDEAGAVIVQDGTILAAGAEALNQGTPDGAKTVDCHGAVVAPGLIDMGVSVGEPGAEHRETLESASRAAAVGGVTTILTSPNTDPVIDDPALVDFMLRRARDTAIVNVHPMAALTKGLAGKDMSEIGLLKEAGAIAFSNDRLPITNSSVLVRLLTYARDFDALVVHQAQDKDLAGSGVMNAGLRASWLGLGGIPCEAEFVAIERDMRLVAMAKGKYHARLISCPQSAEAIQKAKNDGLNVTAGISINHLTLNENDIGPYRTFHKMSPPLRTEDDRQAMVKALADGTIDIIMSDHNPQDVETKRHPFAEAEYGALGLETMLGAGMRLVLNEDISLSKLLATMTCNPADRLGLPAGRLSKGAPADLIVFDPQKPWIVEKDKIRSRSKNTPFEDETLTGRVLTTIVAGGILDHDAI